MSKSLEVPFDDKSIVIYPHEIFFSRYEDPIVVTLNPTQKKFLKGKSRDFVIDDIMKRADASFLPLPSPPKSRFKISATEFVPKRGPLFAKEPVTTETVFSNEDSLIPDFIYNIRYFDREITQEDLDEQLKYATEIGDLVSMKYLLEAGARF